MDHSILKKILLTTFITLFAIGSLFAFQLTMKISMADKTVRMEYLHVIKAFYLSKINSSYWINEFLKQADTLRSSTKAERVSFYKAVIICCNLDTSNALIFVETVGDDSLTLANELTKFQSESRFDQLEDLQKKQVTAWAIEMYDTHEANEPRAPVNQIDK